MSICVVIPAYNDSETIGRAIKSATADGTADEVIIVDDGSTDRTVQVVDEMDEPNVRVISQPNSGPAAARNAGAAEATAEFIVFLDADDQLLPGALALFLETHRSSRSPLVRSGAFRDFDPGSPVLAESSNFAYPRGAPLAGTFSVSRALFRRVGGYDVEFRFGENSELLFRLISQVGPEYVAYIHSPTVQTFTRSGRTPDFYDDPRRMGALRLIEMHGAALRGDHSTLANHHAIAAVQSRRGHYRKSAIKHSALAVRHQPSHWRHWARICRMLLP